MANQDVSGVFQKEDGFWGYRFSIVVGGKRIAQRKYTDEKGNKLKTKREASKAREKAMALARVERKRKTPVSRRTVKEVFEEYRSKGRTGKAYQTIRKQDSLWDNHLCERFGKRFIDDISSADVVDYLTELYYENDYSFMYVESFLKMFYLIFGQAYSRNYLSVDDYNRLCVNKDTKIKMPKLKIDDDTEIVAFSRNELAILDEYFKGTNAETAYLLGRYCGLRINECFGLKWENVDLAKGTILIDRQMQYQDGIIKLVPPKTRNAKRTLYLCDTLKIHFQRLKEQREQDALRLEAVREQKQRFIDDLDGSKISSTELVNCLPNGTIQTVNSMKYPTREIKAKFGIVFKFHYLRHTYGTLMAEMNTPTHLLCNQMGHSNIHITQRYYIAISSSGVDVLNGNLNRL